VVPVTSSFQTQYLFGLPLAQDLPSVQAISRCHSFFTSKVYLTRSALERGFPATRDMMKRSTRSIDVPKLRRNMKNRSRIAETMCCGYLSGFAYVKLLVLWLVCIALDLLIGFRFELLYPVWLLIRNCYDSFRFQGLVSSLQYSKVAMAKLDHIYAGFFPLASICFYIAVDLKSEVKCEVVVSGWLASLDDYASFQAFSAFFVCATATTDLICFVLLPVQLLLFLASTYVWVQFVWHTAERGVGSTQVLLWVALVSFEYNCRYRGDSPLYLLRGTTFAWTLNVVTGGVLSSWLGLRDSPSSGGASESGGTVSARECSSRAFSSSSVLGGFGVALTAAFAHSSSLTSDLCRPFAAHCIGYPVVTLGFGLKTYMSLWRFKRRQREVSRENEVYGRLLVEALPSIYEGPKVYPQCNTAAIQDHESAIDYETELLPSLAICASPSSGSALSSQRKSSRAGSSWKQNGCKQINAKRIPSHSNGSLLSSRKDQTNHNANDDDDTASTASVSGTSRMSLWRLAWDVILMAFSLLTGGGGESASSSLDDRISLSSNEIESEEEMMEQEETSSQPDDLPVASSRLLSQQRSNNAKKSKGSCTRVKGGRTRARNMHPQSEYVLGSVPTGPSLSSPSLSASCSLNNNLLNLTTGGTANEKQLYSPSSALSPTNNYQNSGGSALGNSIFIGTTQSVAPIANKVGDDYVTLEEVEALKGELRAARCQETDLRYLLQQAINAEKQAKGELAQLKMKHEQTDNKLSNLVKAREQDKCSMQLLEKRLIEAHAKKNELEKELNAERRSKLKEEHAAARALAAAQSIKNVDCGEACKARKADLEREIRATRRDLKAKEELTSVYEEQLRQLREFKDNNDLQELQSTLASLRDKNHHLEQSLSAENRLKQDLFRVLTETRSQTEMLQQQLRAKDLELMELRQRLSNEANDTCKISPTGNSRGAWALNPRYPAWELKYCGYPVLYRYSFSRSSKTVVNLNHLKVPSPWALATWAFGTPIDSELLCVISGYMLVTQVQALNSSSGVRCGGPSGGGSLLSPVVNGAGGALKMSSSVNTEQNMELLTAALSSAASSAYLPYSFGGHGSGNEHLLFDATVSAGGPGVNAPSSTPAPAISVTANASGSADSLRFSNTSKFCVPSAPNSASVRST
uniref:Macoilin n=1 Tax=Ascaris lumbricoides TaxID=6252 RepID=A0A9J2PLX6_ASCLU